MYMIAKSQLDCVAWAICAFYAAVYGFLVLTLVFVLTVLNRFFQEMLCRRMPSDAVLVQFFNVC